MIDDKKVLVTLSKDEHITLKNLANILKIPMSDILRIALKSYLGKIGKKDIKIMGTQELSQNKIKLKCRNCGHLNHDINVDSRGVILSGEDCINCGKVNDFESINN